MRARRGGGGAEAWLKSDGSPEHPFRLVIVPSEGGTVESSETELQPTLGAITRVHGLRFDTRVGQSYAAVVEGMAAGKVDIAYLGAVTFYQASRRGVAELLAVGVEGGESVYYSGIFVLGDSAIRSVADLAGKSVAFGDVNSTSSFNYPLCMMVDAGLDPVNDLGPVYITGSHANSLAALAAGKVDAACASYQRFENAVTNGRLDASLIRPLAKSGPIPYPPLAMHPRLRPEVRGRLRETFHRIHEQEGVEPGEIRGYGGKIIGRYDAYFSEEIFDRAMSKLFSRVTEDLRTAMLEKAGRNND